MRIILSMSRTYFICVFYFNLFDFTSNMNQTIKEIAIKNIPHHISTLTVFSVITQYNVMLPQIKIDKHKLIHAITEYVFFFFSIKVVSFNFG